MNDFSNRKYVIFDTSELGTINFEEVLETSYNTCRKSLDSSMSIVKWETDIMPMSIESLTTKSITYTHTEILEILSGTSWSPKLFE